MNVVAQIGWRKGKRGGQRDCWLLARAGRKEGAFNGTTDQAGLG